MPPPNQIALYVGLLIVVFGALDWAIKPPEPNAQNVFKMPGGFEFTLNTPALAVINLGIVLVLIAIMFSETSEPPHPIPATTPYIVPIASQTSPALPPKPRFTKTVCTGELEKSCAGAHDIFITCGDYGSDDQIAMQVCHGTPSKALRTNTKGGNHCGYSLIEVTCN